MREFFENAYPCSFCKSCHKALYCEKYDKFKYCRVIGDCLPDCFPDCFIPINTDIQLSIKEFENME